jgi:hypothetical protein
MNATSLTASEVREHWLVARELMAKCPALAVASVSAAGTPHVTPIGSLHFDQDTRGVFIDIFTDQLSRNLEHNPVVSIMALRMSPALWFRAMLQGRFPTPPAVRIVAEVGPRRPATSAEQQRWRRRVRRLKRLKGHDLLWSKLDHARDVRAQRIVPVRMGAMTAGLFADHAEIDLAPLTS